MKDFYYEECYNQGEVDSHYEIYKRGSVVIIATMWDKNAVEDYLSHLNNECSGYC